jgi:FtsH-binding integral membrane protein
MYDYDSRRAVLRVYARLAGASATILGGALVWAGCYFVLDADHKLRAIVGLLVLMGLGFPCVAVGLRLAFNRPNRYGSLLSPAAWYLTAFLFGAAGVALSTSMLMVQDYTSALAGAIPGLVAFACYSAGSNAKNDVKDSTVAL